MIKNMLSLLVIFVLILTVSISYSGEVKREEQKTHNRETTKILREDTVKSKKSVIDLLFLKYDVNSDSLKKDLFEYLEYLDPDFFSPDLRRDKIRMKKVLDQTVSGKIIEIETLISLSKKHKVSIKTLSGIVYDYLIWIEVKQDYQNEK